MYKPGIDITVVNYRTPGDLARFCESLVKHPPSVPYSVRIFNVAPLAIDIDVAQTWAGILPNARDTGHDNNVGYGTAVNTCVKRGDREYIAAFNADVLITEGAFDTIIAAMGEHDDWGVVGPRQINSKNELTHGGIVGPLNNPRFRVFNRPGAYTDVLDDVPTVMGAAYFMRRKCWDELAQCEIAREIFHDHFGTTNYGAFLPTQLYYEETFCSYHAKAHGWKVVYFGAATLVHEWHRSIREHLSQQEENGLFARSQQQFRRACEAHGIDHD
jgi:GT2 family glycosyltransferase